MSVNVLHVCKAYCAFLPTAFQIFCRLMDIAKEMTREVLPIKCLEAVILAMYPFTHATGNKD